MATKTKLTEGELFDPSTKTGWKLIPEQGWQYFDKGIVKTPGTTAKNNLKKWTGVVYEAGKSTRRYVDQFVEQDKKLRAKQRESKIQEYKDFGKAVSEIDVEKETGRVLKNLGNAFADIPKKFVTEPLESVTGSGVFQDGKELTVKQYKDSMTRARVSATENDSNSVSYGSDVGLGVENDISEYFNYSGFDPNTDAGYFTASFDQTVDPISSFSKDLADRSLFNLKDNSAIGPSYYQAAAMPVKPPVEELPTAKFAESVVNPPVNEGTESEITEDQYRDVTIEKGKETSNTIGTIGDKAWTQDTDPNREGYIGGKRQSAIQDKLIDAGFTKQELSDLMESHAAKQAERFGGGDKINIDTPASATKAIEGGTNFLDLLKIRPIMNLFGGGR